MLAQASSPSADLYFAFSMASDLEERRAKRLSPTVFLLDETLIVVRHLSGLRLRPNFKRLVYVIDDDWRAGLKDPALPIGYRAKLALREARHARQLENRADVILCSSELLSKRLKLRWPNKTVRILEPAWPKAHSPLAAERPARLAYLSAATHRADFDFIRPVLEFALSTHGVHLTVTANAPIPITWKTRQNITIAPVMNWQSYLDWIPSQHFDIGFYPTCATVFNAARSRNKLLEFDQFGAALLCSNNWQAGASSAAQGRCISCSDDYDDWRNALSNLINSSGRAKAIATTNRTALAREDPLILQRAHWLQILERDCAEASG